MAWRCAAVSGCFPWRCYLFLGDIEDAVQRSTRDLWVLPFRAITFFTKGVNEYLDFGANTI
jgi:hypothetical protein